MSGLGKCLLEMNKLEELDDFVLNMEDELKSTNEIKELIEAKQFFSNILELTKLDTKSSSAINDYENKLQASRKFILERNYDDAVEGYLFIIEKDSNWNNGIRSGAWIGLNSDSQGNLSFADGEKLDANFKSPFGDLQNDYPEEYRNKNTRSGYHLLMKDPSGHAQRHGGLNTWWREPVSGSAFYDNDEGAYWGYNYGIAEVPLCTN